MNGETYAYCVFSFVTMRRSVVDLLIVHGCSPVGFGGDAGTGISLGGDCERPFAGSIGAMPIRFAAVKKIALSLAFVTSDVTNSSGKTFTGFATVSGGVPASV